MAFFALVWAAAAASGLDGRIPAVAAGLCAVLLTGAAVAVAVRSGSNAALDRNRRLPERWNRGIGLVNAVQTVAIVATVLVLVNLGEEFLIPSVICLIVGVHFFPLARLYDQGQYRWTGALLSVVALAGFVSSAAGTDAGATRAVVGLGAALVLWGTSAHVARRN